MAHILERLNGLKRLAVAYHNELGQMEVLCDERGQEINFARKAGAGAMLYSRSWTQRRQRATQVSIVVGKIEHNTFGVRWLDCIVQARQRQDGSYTF